MEVSSNKPGWSLYQSHCRILRSSIALEGINQYLGCFAQRQLPGKNFKVITYLWLSVARYGLPHPILPRLAMFTFGLTLCVARCKIVQNERLINFEENKSFFFSLPHYSLTLLIYTPWKHQKTFRITDVFRGIDKQCVHWAVMEA